VFFAGSEERTANHKSTILNRSANNKNLVKPFGVFELVGEVDKALTRPVVCVGFGSLTAVARFRSLFA
jgi:hypothetical protein